MAHAAAAGRIGWRLPFNDNQNSSLQTVGTYPMKQDIRKLKTKGAFTQSANSTACSNKEENVQVT